MTAIRQEAMQMLERIPEDKLSYVVQIMQAISGLLEKTEKKANETDTENKTDKADKKDDSAQETGEIRADADERAEDKASAKPEETTVSAESDVRPSAKKHIDMRL